MTTNGALLRKYAAPLRNAGVSRLNISLDTLNPDRYREITRVGNLSDTLDGINAAREAGFERIKINAVLMRGENDDEIRALVELTRKASTHVRFIELMPIGTTAEWSRERHLENSTVLRAIPELEQTENDGVATMYKLPDAIGSVGLISPISSHFCPACNRIRITADGKLKPCLHSAAEVNLRGLHGDALLDTMHDAIFTKPRRHHIDEAASDSARDMFAIGG